MPNWNLDQYYRDQDDGLIAKLLLPSGMQSNLVKLRAVVRKRIKDVFKEVQDLVAELGQQSYSVESYQALFESKASWYSVLDDETKREFVELIGAMTPEAKAQFMRLTPRFWTQGSFKYDTLNLPYITPPQEMDIDDGAYLPMVLFQKPIIGHKLLLLLVDTALKSLVQENQGWEFEAKRTCGRIKIPSLHTHIDVPMYAIPEQQFLQKQATLESSDKLYESISRRTNDAEKKGYSKLDKNSVNLAIRQGSEKWMLSDPQIVEDWFKDCCERIGQELRLVCRFLKAWRDVQWAHGGGPSSICLMAAAVDVLDTHPHNRLNLGDTMKLVASHLPGVFESGVESPDDTDEKPLFPSKSSHGEQERAIVTALRNLHERLLAAENACTADQAIQFLAGMYGNRVSNVGLLKSIATASAPAFTHPPSQAQKPVKISPTMSSGSKV